MEPVEAKQPSTNETSEDDDEFAVVGLDLDLSDFSAFNNPLGFPLASIGSRGGKRSGQETGRRAGSGFHRKDRLFFAGPPPPVPATETKELDAQNFLVISNLHWIMSDADVWDGGCAYAPVRGVYVFEETFRKKSEGVALIEFISHNGPINAQKDSGRAWASKQSDRPAHLYPVSEAVMTALQNQVGSSTMEESPHWTRTVGMGQDLVTAVFMCAGKVPTTLNLTSSTGGSGKAQPVADKAEVAPESLTIPVAIQALIDQIEGR